MLSVPHAIAIRFCHTLVQADQRTLILATCNRCGEKKTCSVWDGTLQAWERRHGRECSRLANAPKVSSSTVMERAAVAARVASGGIRLAAGKIASITASRRTGMRK